ncbi:hypothetical protein PoB_002687100 [Plakobranchus ocellatus]|uniref:Uncharacterized protein n=1 Tax=Plakobranchus ocellatus TaxID=259542 RepID=A0AAV3ZWQ2_9GAST|nr:hypothetical protein PoB_002687100 [Plakobranchus ocellatus]
MARLSIATLETEAKLWRGCQLLHWKQKQNHGGVVNCYIGNKQNHGGVVNCYTGNGSKTIAGLSIATLETEAKPWRGAVENYYNGNRS